jgi:hypothetical protein
VAPEAVFVEGVRALHLEGSDGRPNPTSRGERAALLHLGLLVYFLRDTADAAARRAMALTGVMGSTAGAAVRLAGVLAGTVNAMGSSTVVIYSLLVLCYATLLGKR